MCFILGASQKDVKKKAKIPKNLRNGLEDCQKKGGEGRESLSGLTDPAGIGEK